MTLIQTNSNIHKPRITSFLCIQNDPVRLDKNICAGQKKPKNNTLGFNRDINNLKSQVSNHEDEVATVKNNKSDKSS